MPNLGTAAIHSAVPAPDGSVWLTEQGSNKLGRWDPQTQKITEYQDDRRKHTIRIDPKTGQVWSTGALTRFDPKTEKYTHIPDVPTSYGIALDADGNAWFTELLKTGKIGKVDAKTLQVTKYVIPTAERAAAAHPGRHRRHGLVRRVRRRQDRALRSEDRDVQGVSAARLRIRRRTRSASMASTRSGTRPNTWTWSAVSIRPPAR